MHKLRNRWMDGGGDEGMFYPSSALANGMTCCVIVGIWPHTLVYSSDLRCTAPWQLGGGPLCFEVASRHIFQDPCYYRLILWCSKGVGERGAILCDDQPQDHSLIWLFVRSSWWWPLPWFPYPRWSVETLGPCCNLQKWLPSPGTPRLPHPYSCDPLPCIRYSTHRLPFWLKHLPRPPYSATKYWQQRSWVDTPQTLSCQGIPPRREMVGGIDGNYPFYITTKQW